MSISATAGAAKIYVFMGFHPEEPFQSVRTDNKWVRYKLLAIAKRVAKGYSSGFGIKNLQTQNGILNGVDVMEYISDILNRCCSWAPTTPLEKYRDLLPDSWKPQVNGNE